MAFTRSTPILRILDETKAKQFYIDFLGFKIDWEHRAEGPLYMQISLGECLLHLSEHSGDCCPGAAVKLHTDKIEDTWRSLSPKIIHRESQNRIWGSQDSLGVVWIYYSSTR